MTADTDDRGVFFPLSAWLVLASAILLTLVGLHAIYAGEAEDGGTASRTRTQAVFAVVGLAGMWLVTWIGHVQFGRAAYLFFAATLVLLALLVLAHKVPLGPVIPLRRNVARWVQLGPIGFQPSEYAKIVFVLALARYLRFRSNYRRLGGLVAPFVLTLVPTGLILAEPDLGTSLLFLPVLFIMLYAAGARLRHLAIVLALGAAAAPVFYVSPLMSAYQRQRIDSWLHQDDPDPRWQMNAGYQLRQSKIAIGSGQWFGQPLEQAAFFRHDMLPEEQNDFIFAVIAHQWGFVGATLVIALYLLLFASGFVAASASNDPFTRLVAVGMTAMIAVQMFINVGMTVGQTPVTGITLPFISAGGSSLVAYFVAVGFLLSAARHRPVVMAGKPFEYGGAGMAAE